MWYIKVCQNGTASVDWEGYRGQWGECVSLVSRPQRIAEGIKILTNTWGSLAYNPYPPHQNPVVRMDLHKLCVCGFGRMFVGLNWILKPRFCLFFHWHLPRVCTVRDLSLFLLQTARYCLSAVLTVAPQPENGILKSKIIFALHAFSSGI